MQLLKDLLTLSLTLFAVIDIVGSIPILIDIKKRKGHIHSEKVVLFSAVLLLSFLFLGKGLLGLIGLDVESFAIAGAIVIFLIGLEMILGHTIFKDEDDPAAPETGNIVPVAFPLIAGAGSITAVISLKAEFQTWLIAIGIVLNLALVYAVLKLIPVIEGRIGPASISILRRMFGVLLIAIAVKIFTSNLHTIFTSGAPALGQ